MANSLLLLFSFVFTIYIFQVQKLMGSTPLDLARSNLAKSGQISRNALCPCGSKKRYKRYSLFPTVTEIFECQIIVTGSHSWCGYVHDTVHHIYYKRRSILGFKLIS